MPNVTFLGPFVSRRRPDSKAEWLRGQPVEVSQEWLDLYRNKLPLQCFLIEGDDSGPINDGNPDSGWTKKDISKWLKANGQSVTGYATKKKLLDLVDKVLNPPALEPEVAPEPEVIEEVPAPVVEAAPEPEPEAVDESIEGE